MSCFSVIRTLDILASEAEEWRVPSSSIDDRTVIGTFIRIESEKYNHTGITVVYHADLDPVHIDHDPRILDCESGSRPGQYYKISDAPWKVSVGFMGPYDTVQNNCRHHVIKIAKELGIHNEKIRRILAIPISRNISKLNLVGLAASGFTSFLAGTGAVGLMIDYFLGLGVQTFLSGYIMNDPLFAQEIDQLANVLDNHPGKPELRVDSSSASGSSSSQPHV